nr:MAG TPA: hypothetical protein [Bacteriophage sp.]
MKTNKRVSLINLIDIGLNQSIVKYTNINQY